MTTLPFSSKVYLWLEKIPLRQLTKYRLQKIILKALCQGDRAFLLKKKEFGFLIETTNRLTQKTFLTLMEEQGIIKILKEDHFRLHFELSAGLFDGETPMEKSPQLELKFEDPQLYKHMSRQDNTKERYDNDITELLSDISGKDVISKMASSEALRKTYQERVSYIRTKLRSFEKRNTISLTTEHANLDAVSKIIESVKVLKPEAKTYEEHKNDQRLKMSPKDIVTYFYRQLSNRIGEKIVINAWPSEIQSAKDVLRQMPDKEPKFITNYIDWVIETQHGIKQVYNIRYYVPHYLQTLDDVKFWTPLWENYISRPRTNSIIHPKSEDELGCLFVDLYERLFNTKYKPLNSFKKDIARLKQLKIYLGDNFDKTVRYITWCMEKVFSAQKEKPSNPADMYRFIQDFRDHKIQNKDIETLEIIIKRAYRRDKVFALDDDEKRVVHKLFQVVPIEQLDEKTREIINKNQEHFDVSISASIQKAN